MQLLNINDQKRIMLLLEKEYCLLVKQYNNGVIGKEHFYDKSKALAQEIRELGKEKYFAEDNVEFLRQLSESIYKTACVA